MMLRYLAQSLLVISVAVVVLMAMALIALRLFGGQLLAVQSNSMQPVFAAGDALIVLPVDTNKVQPGEIVSYRNPTGDNTIVSHRIVAIDSKLQTVTTRGDAQKQAEPVAMTSSQMVGRVVGMVPGLGRAMMFVQNPIALIAVIYVPMAVLLFREMERLYRHFSRPQYQLVSRR